MDTYAEKCLKLLDIEKNGIADLIYSNTEKYRKGSFTLGVTDGAGKPLAGEKLRIELKNHEFKFGSTAFLADTFNDDELKRSCYEEQFSRLFNQAVAAFYWRDDEPRRGCLRFERGSEYIYRRSARIRGA